MIYTHWDPPVDRDRPTGHSRSKAYKDMQMANKFCKGLAQTCLFISFHLLHMLNQDPVLTLLNSCHMPPTFTIFPWQSGIETNLHPPPICTCCSAPSLTLSLCCRCIVVSFRTSQCIALMMCATVGELYKDFPVPNSPELWNWFCSCYCLHKKTGNFICVYSPLIRSELLQN